MAWLTKTKRKNPKTGKLALYRSIAYRDPETRKIKTKGLGFTTERKAKVALNEVRVRLDKGLPVVPPGPSATSRGCSGSTTTKTLRELLEDVYLPVVKRDKAPKTYDTRRTSANALIATLGDLHIDEIDFQAVDRHITRRKAMGRRSRTIILELTCLRQALNRAVDLRLLTRLPKLPKLKDTDRKPHRFLTEAETVRLLDALRPLDVQPHVVTRGKPPITRDPLSYLAVLMALNTGMRRGEIMSRTWDDLLWDKGPLGTLLVRAKPSVGFKVKTRRERAIPLTPELADELQRAYGRAGRPERGWIFPSPKDPSVHREEFKSALRRACKDAGLPYIHQHGLRHTWASRLAMAGVDRKTLMVLGGWTTGHMLDEIYAHVTSEHTAQVMAKMGVGPNDRPALRMVATASDQSP